MAVDPQFKAQCSECTISAEQGTKNDIKTKGLFNILSNKKYCNKCFLDLILIMRNNNLTKGVFYLTFLVSGYFLLAFTGVLQNADSKIIDALFELLTIPLILIILAIFIFSIYQLVAKHVGLTFYPIANILMSGAVILSMFFVK